MCKLKKEIMRIQQGNENSLVYSEPFKDSSRESDGNKKKKEKPQNTSLDTNRAAVCC